MTPSGRTHINDWQVDYSCYEFKPDGWIPSHPLKYATCATAVAPRRSAHPSHSAPAAQLRYPQEGYAAVFNSDREGLEAALAELTERIRVFEGR